MAKSKKQIELEQQIGELTQDLQRTRADFENYRKRVEADRAAVYQQGQASAIIKLLPMIDNIERAIAHAPADLAKNKWAQGVVSLTKSLEKILKSMDVVRIDASQGVVFNPELHEAVQVDEAAEGDKEVVTEELQAGYIHAGITVRPAMVKVTRTQA